MAKTKETRNRSWLKMVIIVATIVAFVAFLYFMTPLGFISRLFLAPNYAEEVAKPIEKALVEAGAVKVCSNGDKGVGPDNETPWYNAYLELNKNRTQTEELVHDTAESNGFALEAASDHSQNNKGYLGDDVYVGVEKTPGTQPRELTIALSNSGPLHACQDEIFNDESHTAITLELRLPKN